MTRFRHFAMVLVFSVKSLNKLYPMHCINAKSLFTASTVLKMIEIRVS